MLLADHQAFDWSAGSLAIAGTILLVLLIYRYFMNAIGAWEQVGWLLRIWVLVTWTAFEWYGAYEMHFLSLDARVLWSRLNVGSMLALFAVFLIIRWRR